MGASCRSRSDGAGLHPGLLTSDREIIVSPKQKNPRLAPSPALRSSVSLPLFCHFRCVAFVPALLRGAA
jgi:hypothetical protein